MIYCIHFHSIIGLEHFFACYRMKKFEFFFYNLGLFLDPFIPFLHNSDFASPTRAKQMLFATNSQILNILFNVRASYGPVIQNKKKKDHQ